MLTCELENNAIYVSTYFGQYNNNDDDYYYYYKTDVILSMHKR